MQFIQKFTTFDVRNQNFHISRIKFHACGKFHPISGNSFATGHSYLFPTYVPVPFALIKIICLFFPKLTVFKPP